MTLYNPSLFINRLRIEKGDIVAYDEKFRKGVNIINGDNSSGKSTILNFIYYALGGDETEWSDEAKSCSRVLIEVEINGKVATLARAVSSEPRQPMDILSGNIERALIAPAQHWLRYPYNRGAPPNGKESFSQALFRLLDIPEAAGETTGKLTMHQVLRLHYADQLSPSDSLFMSDEKWDRPVIRDAVGRLVCGSEETKLLENKLEVSRLERLFAEQSAELRAMFSALGETGESLTVDFATAKKDNLVKEIAQLSLALQDAEKHQITLQSDPLTLDTQEAAYDLLVATQSELALEKSKRDNLTLSILDLENYVASLKRKLNDIRNAQLVQETIGSVHFNNCPACFEEIIESFSSACHLCKAPVAPERQKDQIVSIINEAAIQIRDAEQILAKKRKELDLSKGSHAEAYHRWQKQSRIFNSVKGQPTSASQAKIRAIQHQLGYAERNLEEQDRKIAVAAKLADIMDKKSKTQIDLDNVHIEIKALEAKIENTIKIAYTAIADEVSDILIKDLQREPEFQNPKVIGFDFGANKISVNGKTYFSASSRALLKSAFITGLMFAAIKKKFFRHLRLCILDTIEDKGMEVARTHRLQDVIVSKSEATEIDHQIIFAVFNLSPNLDKKKYVVGQYHTKDNPTLKLFN